MLILELSSHILRIPNDADILFSQVLIGCPSLRHEYCQLIWLHREIMGRQLYTLSYPIWGDNSPTQRDSFGNLLAIVNDSFGLHYLRTFFHTLGSRR